MYEPENEPDPMAELTLAECWERLKAEECARLAYHLAGEVHIAPINYTTDGARIYFRTSEGSKLLGMTMNKDVAVEIDHWSDDVAWSVLLRGLARVLEGHEALVVEDLPLRPWVPTAKHVVIAITPHVVTGRTFHLRRPWTHMRPEGSGAGDDGAAQ